jgi:GTP-binding protein
MLPPEDKSPKLKPIIAIIGRPNVGKSTLFNRITHTRNALVANISGLTRDPKVGIGKVGNAGYIIVDTGGVDSADEDELSAAAASKALQVAKECSAIILVVDGRSGSNASDIMLANELRKFNIPVTVAINKTEGLDFDLVLSEFSHLQIGPIIPVSAAHGEGIISLIEPLTSQWEVASYYETDDDDLNRIRIAVLGRPNVGKSTLVNRILGDEKMITSDIPGTTRDSVEFDFARDDQSYVIIDTAGVRKKGKTDGIAEKFSVMQTLRALDRANTALLVIDAREPITGQDLNLLGLAIDSGRSIVIAVNKWDSLSEEVRDSCRAALDRRLRFARYAEICFISALKGTGLKGMFESINTAAAASIQKHKTNDLTKLLIKALETHQPPMVQGRRIKLRFAHMGGNNPPKIIIHGNQGDQLPESYKKYLENFFRQELKLIGTPIKIFFLKGDNPFSGRKNQLTKRQLVKKKRLMRFVKKH